MYVKNLTWPFSHSSAEGGSFLILNLSLRCAQQVWFVAILEPIYIDYAVYTNLKPLQYNRKYLSPVKLIFNRKKEKPFKVLFRSSCLEHFEWKKPIRHKLLYKVVYFYVFTCLEEIFKWLCEKNDLRHFFFLLTVFIKLLFVHTSLFFIKNLTCGSSVCP